MLCHDPLKFASRRQHFHKLVTIYKILLIQEVHGDSEAIARYLHGLMTTHTYFFSPGPDTGTGGILIVINKTILHEAIFELVFLVFQPGRLVNLEAKFPFGQFSVWGFHDFGISLEVRLTPKMFVKVNMIILCVILFVMFWLRLATSTERGTMHVST